MNRLVHLRQTLPVNIAQNKDYGNIEFVVLDYNSNDGMEDWARSHLDQYIRSGIVKYYKTYEPRYFDLSHSKNMALRLATGNILCLVDADNYAGDSYAHWISSIYASQGKETIITTLRKDHIPLRDQGGKLCFNRDSIYAVKGFDESLVGYGIDDVDLVRRVEKIGDNRYFIDDEKFLKFIEHSIEERLKNRTLFNQLESIYLLVTENMDKKNIILYLFKDKTFFEITFEYKEYLKNRQLDSYLGWVIPENGYRTGVFSYSGNKLVLTFEGKVPRLLESRNSSTFYDESLVWTKISRDDSVYLEFVMAYGECMNRKKYHLNELSRKTINDNGWGKGTVYLNFDKGAPIVIN